MNHVQDFVASTGTTYHLGALTRDNFDDRRSAFIGQCEDGPKDSLYLVNYTGIFLATNPRQTWSEIGCYASVTQFVDVEIRVIQS